MFLNMQLKKSKKYQKTTIDFYKQNKALNINQNKDMVKFNKGSGSYVWNYNGC